MPDIRMNLSQLPGDSPFYIIRFMENDERMSQRGVREKPRNDLMQQGEIQ